MTEISICWLRRDLRLGDNAALYYALRSKYPVLVIFIFDEDILNKLTNEEDTRVTFIHQNLENLASELQSKGTALLVKHGGVAEVWSDILTQYNVQEVYTNHDYEPYATRRDQHLSEYLHRQGVKFLTFKDQVVFEKDEIIKADRKPYTVFTPYYKQWLKKFDPYYIKPYPTSKYFKNLHQIAPIAIPSLNDIGFKKSNQQIPSLHFEDKLNDYDKKRDYPAADATTHLGIHLRFGTVSIRQVVQESIRQNAHKWLSELVWREFYMMILWHFPHIIDHSFKPVYDKIEWRNNENEFAAWCKGETGYPIIDAGMRQLNETGFMHNRVRMVVASFLCKHLLIDWRWGEAYFAEKLLDYEQASNVGGWQWACGSGNDAAPYFRVFNPELQLKKFDPKLEYVHKWAPAYRLALHPIPIVDHAFARDRVLKVFKKALK